MRISCLRDGEFVKKMKPHVRIASARVSDGTTLAFAAGEVVVFVGPNNAGKSAVLRNIYMLLRNAEYTGEAVKSIKVQYAGSEEDLLKWLTDTAVKDISNPTYPLYRRLGAGVHLGVARERWTMLMNGKVNYIEELVNFFCCFLTTETRLAAANPAPATAITREGKTNPIHFLYADEELERSISSDFRAAFREDLIVHRGAGSEVPLHVGRAPEVAFETGQRWFSPEYVKKIEAMPPLHTQATACAAS